uniref:Reverse transcriptase Ty1/copia-type domain-containing protein n=1 Tax=Fagus sylvatica TaxID=28930 RepID=A0A2N9FZV3_FAGSY
MPFLILIAFTLISAFLLSKYLSKSRTKNLPKGSLGYPLIGETLGFLRAQTQDRGQDWIDERILKHGSVFKTSLMGSPTVVIIGKAGNKFILGAEDDVFAAKLPVTAEAILGKESILGLTVSVPVSLHSHASSIPMLNGTNFSDWKEQVQFHLEHFKTADKSLAGTLMAKLTTMKFDGTRGIQEHVLEMTNLAAQLKTLGMKVDEFFLGQFILNSLPPQKLGYHQKDCPKRSQWFEKKGQCPGPFAKLLEKHGICAQYTMPGTPQQNGVAERRNRTLMDMVRRSSKDPISFSQALESVDSTKWMNAMKDELKSMDQNEVWELVELPKRYKKVGCKWVYKTKRDSKGNIERFKARLVAKGRYQSNPGIDHWKVAKKVMRYLQGTKDFMLTFRRSHNLEVTGYSNSDFAECIDSRKSIFGYLFMLAGEAISWKSEKQTIIASSTMEAEFVACFEATVHGLWLRNFISGLGIVDSVSKPLRIYEVLYLDSVHQGGFSNS